MTQILTAAGIMFGLAGFFGTVLAIANRWLRVEEDPRVELVENMLPGTNCGACGQPGCHAFAEALVAAVEPPAGCTVSSPENIQHIAHFLGVSAGQREKRVARLHCAGGRREVRWLADYRGVTSCRAAFVVNGGGRACPWGCLGLGDCERACTFGAIFMNDNDLPVVVADRCTACNDCVEVCPLDLFTLEPISTKLLVQCSAPLAGDAARAACQVACDACTRCVADSPEGALVMEANLPRIRQPGETTEEATFRCPTGAIVWLQKDQFAGSRPRELTPLKKAQHA
ncbi:MAG: 4Fe-4S binding protein [Acidobacteriota bacterium]|nr:MAG: 4Fe-4S binding protein [Acidobacteriota bacterium]